VFAARAMELPQSVFAWLVKFNVMHESYVVSRQPAAAAAPAPGKPRGGGAGARSGAGPGPVTVRMNQQAANAMLSGHAFYYVCYNISFAQGTPFTSSTLVGNPGEETSTQAALYNWQILSDVFGSLGFQLSQDHRNLIVGGDVKIIAELMKDLYSKYGGQNSQDTQAKRWASPSPSAAGSPTLAGSPVGSMKSKGSKTASILTPLPQREGAVSVDSGLRELQDRKASSKTLRRHDTGVEASRQRFLAKLEREREAARAKEEEEKRAEDLRMRISASIDYSRFRTDDSESLSKFPVFMEFQNRGAVGFCLEIVESIIESVESGEAQAALAEKERARKAARRAAKERKQKGMRLVDFNTPLQLPPQVDHKTALMVASIVREDIVGLALRDDVHAILAERAAARLKEKSAVEAMIARLGTQMEKAYAKAKPLKYEDQLKVKEEQEATERARHGKRMERLRLLNREAAVLTVEKSKMEKELEVTRTKAKTEDDKKKEAERTLYLAEQKAKVLERRREREQLQAEDAERKRREEEEARNERRKQGMELNKKLQQKEQQRLKSLGKKDSGAPATLSAFNLGTGDHAAYFGDTLGWQYLTESEFDVAQMLCQARTDPPSMIPCVQQYLDDMQGKIVYYTDEHGKRHPCSVGEGRPGFEEAIKFLSAAKAQRPIDDISIGLTLAARQHAMDLVYHGIARTEHTGSDGSTLTQRVLRYGSPAMRHGCVELVSCIVRPATLRVGPVDVVTRFIVDEGDRSRRMRDAAYTLEMHESAGVGHAIAEFEGLLVEAYVVILSFGFLDKPVAQMASAHHTNVRAVAAPFIDGLRRVHDSVADRRHLMAAGNVSIGRLTDAKPNVDYLHGEKLQRRRHAPPPSGGQSQPRGTSNRRRNDEDDSRAASPDDHNAPEAAPQRSPEEEAVHQERRKRVERFYRRYAPAKINIVDDAVRSFEGRFQELIDMLTAKYGPEPPVTPPPPPPPPQKKRDSGPSASSSPAPSKESSPAPSPTKANQPKESGSPTTGEASGPSNGDQPQEATPPTAAA
jgi:hypothetical protein